MKKILLVFTAVALIMAMLAGCAGSSAGSQQSAGEPSSQPEPAGQSGQTEEPAATAAPQEPVSAETAYRFAESYDEVFELLNTVVSRNANLSVNEARAMGEPQGDGGVGTTGAGAGVSDYSDTNTQVAGVDEGDIVKTDGQYIYVLNQFELVIYKADGAATAEVGRVSVGYPDDGSAEGEYSYREKYPSEMYIYGDRAVVISNYYSYSNISVDTENSGNQSEEYASVDFFDISDRSAPKQLASLGQTGNSGSSRLCDGKLYVITNYYVWNYDENDPQSYLPCIYRDGVAETMAYGDICILPDTMAERYSVVCSYDVDAASLTDKLSILGGGDNIYMNGDTLYLAGSRTDVTEGEPYMDGVYTVVDYKNRGVTDIMRVELGAGLSIAASATVPGYVDSQFSMDEYNGYFRLVTTVNSYSYTVYTDKDKGFENTVWADDDRTVSGLYILDSALKATGSVEDLAEGEHVYSARFDGGMAYFCTYETVDPLFAVDVSDPAAPKVLSALKISGFSEYLHLWDEGRLLGIGLEADEATGRTSAVKLVMFDSSDPANVTVKNTMELDFEYTSALYNHKAVFVSLEKNLIAFSDTDNGRYVIYGYDDETGFTQRASVAMDNWGWNTRGMYIGDYVYVVSDSSLHVLDINSLTVVSSIYFAMG